MRWPRKGGLGDIFESSATLNPKQIPSKILKYSFSCFNFISNTCTRSFIQKEGQLHEEAEVRHSSKWVCFQLIGLPCEGSGKALGGPDGNGGLLGVHILPRPAIQWMDYSVFPLSFLPFSKIKVLFFRNPKCKAGNTEKLLVPFVSLYAWMRKQMETHSRKQHFLMLSLAGKNCGPDSAESQAVAQPGSQPSLQLHQ